MSILLPLILGFSTAGSTGAAIWFHVRLNRLVKSVEAKVAEAVKVTESKIVSAVKAAEDREAQARAAEVRAHEAAKKSPVAAKASKTEVKPLEIANCGVCKCDVVKFEKDDTGKVTCANCSVDTTPRKR